MGISAWSLLSWCTYIRELFVIYFYVSELLKNYFDIFLAFQPVITNLLFLHCNPVPQLSVFIFFKFCFKSTKYISIYISEHFWNVLFCEVSYLICKLCFEFLYFLSIRIETSIKNHQTVSHNCIYFFCKLFIDLIPKIIFDIIYWLVQNDFDSVLKSF